MTVRKFLTCRLRSRSTAGSSVGPSTPQFQLRLSFAEMKILALESHLLDVPEDAFGPHLRAEARRAWELQQA